MTRVEGAARAWALQSWPLHRLFCKPLVLWGLRLLTCTSEVKTLPWFLHSGPPPLPKVSELKALTLEGHTHVDRAVKKQSIAGGGKTGWGTGLDWEIGTGRCPGGQMADAERALGPGPGQDPGEITRELAVWALV